MSEGPEVDRGGVLRAAFERLTAAVDEYGLPENSFADIAKLWNWWLRLSKKDGPRISPRDVAMMMVLLKLARHRHQIKFDNLVDACGYLTLYADLTELG